MKLLKFIMLALSLSLYGNVTYAYDCSANGIYYEYINNKTALSITHNYTKIWKYNEVTGRNEQTYLNSYSGNVVVPDSVKIDGKVYPVIAVGERAFAFSDSLKSVSLPSTISSMESGAFYVCESLESVTIHSDKIKKIPYDAFNICPKLSAFNIPESVTSIEEKAFEQCGLKSIEIPDNVMSMGIAVFRYCDSLTDVIIGNGMTSIPYATFVGCKSLNQVLISEAVTTIGHGAFFDSGIKTITFPSNLTTIESEAFSNCKSLKSVVFNEKIKTIEESAFQSCGIKDLIIPSENVEIQKFAFCMCDSMTSATINGGELNSQSFYNCPSLTTFTLGEHITRLYANIFGAGTTSLRTIYCLGNTPPLTNDEYHFIRGEYTVPSFYGVNCSEITLYIPAGTYSQYYDDIEWREFNIIELQNSNIRKHFCETNSNSRYSLNGVKLSSQSKGINIVRMEDGTTKKVIVR